MACVIASWISTLEGKSRCNWVSDARQEGKQAKAKARRPNDERPSKVGNYGEGRVCDKQAATALTTFTSLASYSVGACCRASSKTRMQRPMESASESLISRQDTEAGEVPAGDAHDVRMHGTPRQPSQHTRQWIMGGLMVAACGLVALSASAGQQSSRQQEAAAFAALVAGEPLTIEVNSDTYMGYGNLTKYPFLAEGYGVLVEPYRSSTLKV